MELRSLTDYMNNDFTLLKGHTTIGRDEITEENKKYLVENFPDWFVGTSVEQEAEIEAERIRVETILTANAEERSPFDADPMTIKPVEVIANAEDGLEISNNDPKAKTKKK